MVRINRALNWVVLDVWQIKKPPNNGGRWLVPVIGSLPEVIQESLKNSNLPVIAWDLLNEVFPEQEMNSESECRDLGLNGRLYRWRSVVLVRDH